MPETHQRRIGALDGWRGLAISLVLIGHFFPAGGVNLARIGVDLFFALSGRLMAELLFARETPLPEFFFRRFSRVYPALAVFVLLSVVLFSATPFRIGARAALAALTFASNYVSVWGVRSAALDHLWSLCVEEHAYLALGAVAWAARRGLASASTLILALAAASLVDGLWRAEVWGEDYYAVFWRSDVAAAPILVAALATLHRERFAPRLGRYAPALLVLGALVKSAAFGAGLRYGLGAIAFAAAAASVEASPLAFRRALELAPLRRLGAASFSIYLWQQPFYEMHARGAGAWTLAAALGCGAASHLLLENPARRRLNARFAAARSSRRKAVEFAAAALAPLGAPP